MKNQPMSPPAAPQAFARAKGLPAVLPPGAGMRGNGARGLQLTPLDHGIDPDLQPELQPSSSHSRKQKARSDLERKDEATKKAIADNIRG